MMMRGEHRAGASRLRSRSDLGMNFVLGLVAVLLLAVIAAPAAAQEQAANFKWYQQHVGLVKDVHFVQSKSAILSTEAGIVASLNQRTNKIAWRSLLPNHEVVEAFVPSEDGHVVFTVSGNGKHASLWNAADGSLMWSQDLYSFADMTDEKLSALQENKGILVSAKFIKDLNGDRADDILVSVYDRVQVLSGKGGHVVWSWTTPNGGKVHQAYVARVKRTETLVVLGTTEEASGSAYFVALLDPATGKPSSEEGPFPVALPSSAKLGNLSECAWIASVSILFCFDANGQDLWHAGIDPLHPYGLEFKKFPYTGGFEAEELEGPKSIIAYPTGLIVRVSNHDVIYGIKGLAIGTVHRYPRDKSPQAYGWFVRVEKRSGYEDAMEDMEVTYIAAATTTETGTTIEIIDCDARKVVHVINDASITTANHGSVRRVFPNAITKKDGSLQFRVLLVNQDHSLSMASGDKMLWTREEALAVVVQSEIIELPAPLALREALQKEFGHEGAGVSVPIVGDLFKRISADAHQLLALTGIFGGKDAGENHQGENDETLTKDRFGLRKLVVVTTQSGKVYALHSIDGSIAWSKFIRNSVPLSLFLSRSASHPPPVGVVVGRDTTSGAGRILQLNLLTGEEVEDATTLDSAVKQSIVLPFMDSAFRHPVLVLDAANQGHVIPDTQENRELVAANADKIHIYVVDKEKASVEGYGVDGDITKPMVLLWNVYFSSSSEVVEAIAPSRSVSVGLPVLIRGDNSVTPKYLNKNLLAVATSSASTFISSTNKRVFDTTVGIYLIDTVTGAVVHHTYHKNAQGPVHLVQGDNWVVYHMWNRKLHRFEMSVLDLFEPQMDWKETTFSARTAPLPQVASQSYVFNSGIRAMATTNTVRGLTQKQIMVGMSSDRLLGIDKRFVDFRRKPKELLTDDDKNEGVIPYMPELLYRASDILNQNNTTAPTYLESTSLVFAWGVDLFYTRVTPSGAFDMLNEDFEYYPLLATVLAVVVLTVVTSFLVASKKLREAWQ